MVGINTVIHRYNKRLTLSINPVYRFSGQLWSSIQICSIAVIQKLNGFHLVRNGGRLSTNAAEPLQTQYKPILISIWREFCIYFIMLIQVCIITMNGRF
jgi:hypothetical protein